MTLLLTFSAFSSVFQGKIEDFQLLSCHSGRCFRLNSPVAYISALDGNYAFDQASLMLETEKTKRTIQSNDVYYDLRMKKVFVRNVGGVDFIYDVASGELRQYGQ